MQEDTIIPKPGDIQGWDRYAYSLNNPTKYIDPTGHWYCPSKINGAKCINDNPDPIKVKNPSSSKPDINIIVNGNSTPIQRLQQIINYCTGHKFAPECQNITIEYLFSQDNSDVVGYSIHIN